MIVRDFINRVRSLIRIWDDRVQDIDIVQAGRIAQSRLQKELEQSGALNLKKTVTLEDLQVLPADIESIIRCLDPGVVQWHLDGNPATGQKRIRLVLAPQLLAGEIPYALFEVRKNLTPIPANYLQTIDFPDLFADMLIERTAQWLISRRGKANG